jgi:hypothetical protein
MVTPSSGAASGGAPITGPGSPGLDHLADQVKNLEGLLAELVGRKFPSVEDKLDRLRDLLAGRRKEHLVVGEFAELVGRTPYTVRRWVSEGKVQAIRIRDGGPRGKLLIPRTELERIIGKGMGGDVPDSSI